MLKLQICHAGNPMEDFCRLLMTSVNSDVRREHFPRIFDEYYKHLALKLGDKYKLECTKEQLWQMYLVLFEKKKNQIDNV